MEGSILEKCAKNIEKIQFFRSDWGNTARMDTAGLGSTCSHPKSEKLRFIIVQTEYAIGLSATAMHLKSSFQIFNIAGEHVSDNNPIML